MEENQPHIFVTGHRNPDVDSIAAATGLAELRRRQGIVPITALCPGIMPERARCLFEKFHYPVPTCRNDIYIRAVDLMKQDIPVIREGTPLFEAVKMLRESNLQRLPVVGKKGALLGMLSPMTLLSRLLDMGDDTANGLTGRVIHTSIDLIARVTEARVLNQSDSQLKQDFKVYVAAMGIDSFEAHLPAGEDRNLAVIIGDRPELHLRALQRRIRILIVTGDKPVEPLILQEAKRSKVSILQTSLDSATVIRRLKFSVPVEYFGFGEVKLELKLHDRIRAFRSKILNHPEDVLPVIDENRTFAGVLLKRSLTGESPFRVMLVDHNEVDQSLPGVEELPIMEVVDHHRIGMMPTATPIKITADVVGSSCTLVASMFKSSGESLTPELAGILLGGIVSDTLNLKSPTTVALDRRMLEWLEKISGVQGSELMAWLSAIDSPLASKSAEEVISSDRKDYVDGRFRFALLQVEETNLELLHQRQQELLACMHKTLEQDHLDFMGLLVTDAVRENSELLMIGSADVLQNLPYLKLNESHFALPGILSRKKQLLPQILSITASLNQEEF